MKNLQQYPTLDAWIAAESVPFSLDDDKSFDAAVARILSSLNESVELLGFGEALHGGEEILLLRNRLFARLVSVHGYTAIAVESSFPRGRIVDDYVAGRGAATYADVQETGFSHHFGRLAANRELVEWMRAYNTDPVHTNKLRFAGFDSPTEMVGTDSPRTLLMFAVDYLVEVDGAVGQNRKNRIDELLGPDAPWENPQVSYEPSLGIGLTPAAAELREECRKLVEELHARREELSAKTSVERHGEAVHYAASARQLLNYHAALARSSPRRITELLGMRDAMMADNLAYLTGRETARGGKVLVFAHNSHLQRGRSFWQLGPDLLKWWPAGTHLQEMLGPRYAVLGTALGESPANGLASPEPGTLEARLLATPGPVRFVPTHLGQGLPTAEIAVLPTRTGSVRNPTYFPLTAQSVTDFDGWIALDTATYTRGGPELPEPACSNL